MMSMRERAISQKTLVCLLQSLEGKTATVEFRDETAVSGKIEHVDGYMNVDMSNVKYTAPSGATREFSQYYCQGKFVRFVQIPDEINVIDSVKDKLRDLSYVPRGRGGRGGRGFGRGGRRGGGGFRPRGSRGGGGRYGGGGGGGGHYGNRRYEGGDRYGSNRHGSDRHGSSRHGGSGYSSSSSSSRYGGGGYRY